MFNIWFLHHEGFLYKALTKDGTLIQPKLDCHRHCRLTSTAGKEDWKERRRIPGQLFTFQIPETDPLASQMLTEGTRSKVGTLLLRDIICIQTEHKDTQKTEESDPELSTDTMKTAVIAFLTCLLVLCVRGQSDNSSEKCKCSNSFMGRVHPKLIKAGPFIHEPTNFCPRVEITIITTANREKCVDPNSPAGKLFLQNSQKKKRAAVSMTTASAQTNTQTSSNLQTTTKL
ncbi:C-X-C motif chemokine 10-like [Xyrichtys novacula]|uniref:C-X-C motif chemokine 10-like n=1 Tax=Xyrichtys novacula TaxID=13765 RepID=A0AAV1G3W8_XYRNO|nr:C-X-C motif chemokine 10-like [Xyrichtys novacula]